MANSDYVKAGTGTFSSAIALDAPIGLFDTLIPYTRSRFATTIDPIRVGMAAMVDYEIMGIIAVGVNSITVARGCADTIPALHPIDSVVWIFDTSSAGSDYVERSAGDTVAVKISPFTIGGGGVPIEVVTPVSVDLNWRFFRPYPPGRFQINAAPWTTIANLNTGTPALHFTWRHRDRVTQGDKLIPHEAESIGPEPGTTYTMRVIRPVNEEVVRTEVGIVGTEFFYRRAQALNDLGQDLQTARVQFTSSRDGFDAWQEYEASFVLSPGAVGDVQYMPFSQRVIEAPYVVNAQQGDINHAGNFAVAMAARPSDRMADYFHLFGNGTPAGNAASQFTPWVTLEFRLPELEVTINVRATSLHDGVPLSKVRVGDLALIDEEIVQVMRVDVSQITVRRGCADTVPAVHIAGARVWIFGAAAAHDPIERVDGEALDYQLRPISYGAPYNLADMPVSRVTYSRRAELPYPPGQMVVNGRPWFEEVQAISGLPITFTWARRNRIGQGAAVVAHEDADKGIEAGQDTRLRFFYETPSSTAGAPQTQNVLRTVDVATVVGGANPSAGTSFVYGYVMALVDGLAAGNALGICGTVRIFCRVSSVRDGLESLQFYVTPIRVPSFPC